MVYFRVLPETLILPLMLTLAELRAARVPDKTGALIGFIEKFHSPWYVALVAVTISFSITIIVSLFVDFNKLLELLALSIFVPFVISFPVSKLLIFYTRRIQKEKDELQELHKIKDTLFGVVSHDFRSPIATVKGALSLMKDGNLSREEFQALAEKLDLNISATINMVDNLIAWAMVQMGGYQLKRTHFHLGEVFSESIQLFKPLAALKNIHVEAKGDLTLKAFADYDITKLLVRNLVSNAIKFTKKGGTVDLSVVDKDELILVSCRDSGIGISDIDLANLFTEEGYFSRGGTNNETGAGLGLKVCKMFTDLQEGNIWAESELGKGSNFTFTLPKN